MARPRGAKNKRSKLGEAAVAALERRGEVSFPRILVAVQKVAENPNHPLMIAAAKFVAQYVGPPPRPARLHVENESVSFVEVLAGIVETPTYRRALEDRRDANPNVVEAAAIPEKLEAES